MEKEQLELKIKLRCKFCGSFDLSVYNEGIVYFCEECKLFRDKQDGEIEEVMYYGK